MKEKKYFVCMLSALMVVLFIMPAWAEFKEAKGTKQMKVGMVDIQKVFRKSKAVATASAVLTEDIAKQKATITDKEGEIRQLEEELGKLEPGAIEARKNKTNKIKYATRELQQLREDAEGENKSKDAELTKKVIGEIVSIVKDYADRENFTFILDRMAVITADKSIVDISDTILSLYDAKKK